MKCPQCGGENFDWVSRCDHCGRQLRDAAVAPRPAKTSPTLAADSAGTTTEAHDSWNAPIFSVGDLVDGRMRVESVLSGGTDIVYVCRNLTYEEIMSTDGAAKSLYFEGSLERRMAADCTRLAVKSVHRRLLWHSRAAKHFEREASLWLSLRPHPHIVRARFFKPSPLTGSGGALLILEYIDGGKARLNVAHIDALPNLPQYRLVLAPQREVDRQRLRRQSDTPAALEVAGDPGQNMSSVQNPSLNISVTDGS